MNGTVNIHFNLRMLKKCKLCYLQKQMSGSRHALDDDVG